jgi:acetyl-CoA C-acetyltransferase
MKNVAIARVSALTPGNFWDRSICELAIEASAPIVAEVKVDALFVAASCALLVQRQADFGAIVADRLGLKPSISMSLDAGDISGAAALHAAWMSVRCGLCESALVVAAAKVSDLSEGERLGLMDCTLDQEADVGRGLDFASQAGLLAGHYCSVRGEDSRAFVQISANNHSAWARHTEGPEVTAAELWRDLVVAPPLVRSDFSQLLDGACAVLLTANDRSAVATIDAIATASDVAAIWDRPNPLAFGAVSEAVGSALGGKAVPRWLEIDTAASVAQLLSERVVEAMAAKDDSSRTVNRFGGTQGRGRVFGASPLYLLADIVEPEPPDSRALVLSVAGLGTRAYAAHVLPRGAA